MERRAHYKCVFTAPGAVLWASDVYSRAIELSGITNAIITTPSSTIDTEDEQSSGERGKVCW